ncbi:MAG TPA: superoxide dismutase family protein [Methylomirabilota bacterium]|nr:superoxide dismutase family protein [Methylomirabilota bacterium]
MRRALVVGAVLILAGCATTTEEKAPLSAEAVIKDKDGKQVGQATLIQTPEGVRIAVSGFRLPPGVHGLHIHAVGVCQPPEFTTAGAHFNPTGKKHGLQSPDGPHAGDLPNLTANAIGEGGIDVVNKLVTLTPGANSLLGANGTSIIIHTAADDMKTDPTGNSGGRIACGVISK